MGTDNSFCLVSDERDGLDANTLLLYDCLHHGFQQLKYGTTEQPYTITHVY